MDVELNPFSKDKVTLYHSHVDWFRCVRVCWCVGGQCLKLVRINPWLTTFLDVILRLLVVDTLPAICCLDQNNLSKYHCFV